MFKSYQTKVEYISNLISPGAQGINHGISTDGRVALLTVKVLNSNDKTVLATKKKEARQTNRISSTSSSKKRFSLPLLPRKRVAAV